MVRGAHCPLAAAGCCSCANAPALASHPPPASPAWRAWSTGEQYLELLGGGALPRAAELRSSTRVIGMHDKGGKAALMESETTHFDALTGAPLSRAVSGLFIRGLGGFASAGRTMSATLKRPPRAPDRVLELPTLPQQALLYRLSGDYNPLHADGAVARSVGFKFGAILHGLCTFGIAARAVLDAFGDGDAARFTAIKVRFAAPALPGETFVAEMWALPAEVSSAGVQRVQLEMKVKEREGVTVINSAYVDLYTHNGDERSKL
jgi:acyl dehydratase